ncbi:MAG: hypothetical protein R3B09_31040 [Nannocystaceae bacterium]
MVRLTVVVPLLLLCACPPPASTPAPTDKPAVAATPEPSDKEQPTFVARGSEPPPPPVDDRAGANFRDPSWYRKNLFPEATLVKEGRSPRDEAGFFASQMTLQLADGTTRDECEKTVSDAVARDVVRLDRSEKDDRVTLTGDAQHYAVTLICGEAKGKMTVYLSYRWTSTPG